MDWYTIEYKMRLWILDDGRYWKKSLLLNYLRGKKENKFDTCGEISPCSRYVNRSFRGKYHEQEISAQRVASRTIRLGTVLRCMWSF
jgi:hypothetical protein